MNHLFNTCDSADLLWNWAEAILQKTDRLKNSIQETIENWRSNFSNNQLVNTIWKIILGFIAWSIWKERNRRVFLNETRNLNHSIDIILQNVKQLPLVKGRIEQDTKISTADLQILKAFNLDKGNFALTPNCRQEINTSLSPWKRPPSGFLKLNSDGASRGNPILADIRGVIRNSEGEIQYTYSRSLGEGTNNELEFAALEQGLRILRKLNAGAAVVEGDS